ncbi:unnamed protein product, partial [Polarella glacialis]
DHWLELATDSYFWHSLPEVMLFEQISEEMQSWVVLASREAHAADPTESLPEISESDSNAAVSKFHLLTSAERVALSMDWSYKSSMLRDSFCNVTTFENVLENLHR